MGPNVKFVSPICGLISERKIGVNFCIPKKTKRGWGGVRGFFGYKTMNENREMTKIGVFLKALDAASRTVEPRILLGRVLLLPCTMHIC